MAQHNPHNRAVRKGYQTGSRVAEELDHAMESDDPDVIAKNLSAALTLLNLPILDRIAPKLFLACKTLTDMDAHHGLVYVAYCSVAVKATKKKLKKRAINGALNTLDLFRTQPHAQLEFIQKDIGKWDDNDLKKALVERFIDKLFEADLAKDPHNNGVMTRAAYLKMMIGHKGLQAPAYQNRLVRAFLDNSHRHSSFIEKHKDLKRVVDEFTGEDSPMHDEAKRELAKTEELIKNTDFKTTPEIMASLQKDETDSNQESSKRYMQRPYGRRPSFPKSGTNFGLDNN